VFKWYYREKKKTKRCPGRNEWGGVRKVKCRGQQAASEEVGRVIWVGQEQR
jgi:hypothetical protein